MLGTAASYVHLGSFPAQLAPRTLLTDRIRLQAECYDFFAERELRPGTEAYPTKEILKRLPHSGALATYVHQLSAPRFGKGRIANYTVFRAFYPSVLLNYNLDGLADDICGWRHPITNMHGTAAAEYGGPAGAEIARLAQEYDIEIRHDDLHPCGPELATDTRLQRKLQVMLSSDPAFVMIVGYTFAKAGASYDDHISLAAFVGRFRDVPVDVYVLDPRPFDLVEMLREELRSNRVHAFPVYWNLLAWAFAQVLSGRLDDAHLGYFHEQMLDDTGPAVVFPREK